VEAPRFSVVKEFVRENGDFSPGKTMLAPQCIRTFFVTAVTWQRRPIFRSERIAQLLLDTLQRYRAQHKFLLHGFVLMPDHFHLLLTPSPDVSLEKSVQLIKGAFSFRVKKELGLNLEVWEKGYTERRVKDPTDYRNHVGYIRENPVRAGLAEAESDYPYSSACCPTQIDPAPPWLKPISEAAFVSPR
jgi:putative transposase